MSNKYYTLVGSRETPDEVLVIMRMLVSKLCSEGWCGRSGGAVGADTCLEEGVNAHLTYTEEPYSYSGFYMEVYLPWKDFNERDSSDPAYYTLPFLSNKTSAEEIAKETHPAWERCSQGAQKLHTRNVYQVLGQDLKTPSKFLVCWAKPKNVNVRDDIVLGGTNTAVQLAKKHGADIINLWYDEDMKRVKQWINKKLWSAYPQ